MRPDPHLPVRCCDRPVPALEHRPELVDQEVVAEVTPPVRDRVVVVDVPHDLGRLCLCVRVGPRRMVHHRSSQLRRRGHEAIPQRLVGTPPSPVDDRGLRHRRRSDRGYHGSRACDRVLGEHRRHRARRCRAAGETRLGAPLDDIQLQVGGQIGGVARDVDLHRVGAPGHEWCGAVAPAAVGGLLIRGCQPIRPDPALPDAKVDLSPGGEFRAGVPGESGDPERPGHDRSAEHRCPSRGIRRPARRGQHPLVAPSRGAPQARHGVRGPVALPVGQLHDRRQLRGPDATGLDIRHRRRDRCGARGHRRHGARGNGGNHHGHSKNLGTKCVHVTNPPSNEAEESTGGC